MDWEDRLLPRWGLVASFPGSSASEREIEFIRARVHFARSGEPGNEARGLGYRRWPEAALHVSESR